MNNCGMLLLHEPQWHTLNSLVELLGDKNRKITLRASDLRNSDLHDHFAPYSPDHIDTVYPLTTSQIRSLWFLKHNYPGFWDWVTEVPMRGELVLEAGRK